MTMVTAPHWYMSAGLLWNWAVVPEHVYDFVTCIARNAEYNTSGAYCDNALEFIALQKRLRILGIELTTSSTYTPESNSLAERTNRCLINKMPSTMSHDGLADQYQSEAKWQAVYLQNRTPSPTTSMMSPHEMLFKKAPNKSMIKVFKCRALVHKYRIQRTNKYDSHAEEDLYIGLRGRIHRVFDPSRTVIVQSKHVHFDKTAFSMQR